MIIVDARGGLCSSPFLGLLANWTSDGALLRLPSWAQSNLASWCILVSLNFSALSEFDSLMSQNGDSVTDIPIVLQMFEDTYSVSSDSFKKLWLTTLRTQALGPDISQSHSPELYRLNSSEIIDLKLGSSLKSLLSTYWVDNKRMTVGNWFSILPQIPLSLQIKTLCGNCTVHLCFLPRIESIDACQSRISKLNLMNFASTVVDQAGNNGNLTILLKSGKSWPSIFFSIFLSNLSQSVPCSSVTLNISEEPPPLAPIQWFSILSDFNVSLEPGETQYWNLSALKQENGIEYFVRIVVSQGEVDICLSSDQTYPDCNSANPSFRILGVQKAGELVFPFTNTKRHVGSLAASGSVFEKAILLLTFGSRPLPTPISYGRWYLARMSASDGIGLLKSFSLDGFGATGQKVKVSLERPEDHSPNASLCPIVLAVNIDSFPSPFEIAGYTALLDVSSLKPGKQYIDIFGQGEFGTFSSFTSIPYEGNGNRLLISLSRCPVGYIGIGQTCVDVNECSAANMYFRNSNRNFICGASQQCFNSQGSWSCNVTNASSLFNISAAQKGVMACSVRFRVDSFQE